MAEALGRNKNISTNLLEKLVSKSGDALVPVFNNPNTSDNLRQKLLEHFRKGRYCIIKEIRER